MTKVAWEVNDRAISPRMFCFVMAETAEDALQLAPSFDPGSTLADIVLDGETPVATRAERFDGGINETDLFIAGRMWHNCPICDEVVRDGDRSDHCDERDDGEPRFGIYCDDDDRDDELYPVIGETGVIYCSQRCWAASGETGKDGRNANVDGICLYADY